VDVLERERWSATRCFAATILTDPQAKLHRELKKRLNLSIPVINL